MTTLDQLSEAFGYAAHTGAAHLATSVTRSAQLQAQTGLSTSLPGPALRSVLAQHSQSSSAQAPAVAASPGQVADHAADVAADEGVALISGQNQ